MFTIISQESGFLIAFCYLMTSAISYMIGVSDATQDHLKALKKFNEDLQNHIKSEIKKFEEIEKKDNEQKKFKTKKK